MTRTVVHLRRHGEVFNPEGVLYGRLPGYVLSDLGHEMAGRAATALAGNDIAAVISSPGIRLGMPGGYAATLSADTRPTACAAAITSLGAAP